MKRYIRSSQGKDFTKAIAKQLHSSLKDYGATDAIDLNKYENIYKIEFDNEVTGCDSTLIHNVILSEGFNEITRHGSDPQVIEYLDATYSVCVKLIDYNDSITLEISEEN